MQEPTDQAEVAGTQTRRLPRKAGTQRPETCGVLVSSSPPIPSPMRPERSACHIYDLYGRVLLKPIHVELDADSRALDAAERRHRMKRAMLVHPGGAAFQLIRVLRGFVRIVAPDGTAQPDIERICPSQRFFHGSIPKNRDDRSELLLGDHPHFVRGASDDSQRVDETGPTVLSPSGHD